MDFKKDFYRQSITFDVVDEYGSKPEKRAYFYDHIVSYADFKCGREPHDGYTAAQSYIILRHKAEDGMFASKKFYTAHSLQELEDLFFEAEHKVDCRRPFELQQSSAIQMSFLRATIPLTVTDSPLAGKDAKTEHIFYDQLVGHGAYTLTSQYYSTPFAKAYVLLKNEGCFGQRKLHITETEAELQNLFKDAEEQMEEKAIGLLKQLNL